MALHIRKSERVVFPVDKRCLQFPSKLFVAEVVLSHVERQPARTWSGGGNTAVV